MPTTLTPEQRNEALAAIFLRIAKKARKAGLLDAVEAAARRLFGLDERDVLRELREGGPGGLLRALPALAKGEWRGRWREGLRPLFADLVSAQGKEGRAAFGAAFDLENPYMQEWLDRMSLELAGQVPETTREKVEREVKEGISNGEGVPDIAKRVGSVFEEAKGSRAKVIARTEANRSANAASWLQARASGIPLEKVWMSADDDRVRPEHRRLDGMALPLDEEFPGGEGRWPSAPNCRCTLVFRPSDLRESGYN